jgi:hypothetical protein
MPDIGRLNVVNPLPPHAGDANRVSRISAASIYETDSWPQADKPTQRAPAKHEAFCALVRLLW